MTVFWLVAGGMLAVALALLLRPLLRARRSAPWTDTDSENVRIARERLAELQTELRAGNLDQVDFERSRQELEMALAADLAGSDTPARAGSGRWLGAIVALAVPALAVYLYLSLGNLAAIDGGTVASMPQDHPQVQAQQQPLPSVDEMIERLVTRLQQQPDDAEGWYMLGRTYLALGRYQAAADAFEKVLALVGDDPNVLVAYADAKAMLQGGRMGGEPMELIQRALQQDPNSPTALWLAGMGYREQGELDRAIESWQRARALMPAESEAQAELQNLIEQAKAEGGTAPPAESTTAQPAPAGPAVQVEVTLAPELRAALDPETTVFVFATPPEGARMPLAAVKRRVADLPLQLRLSDADAVAPVARISDYEQVQVGARVSMSGNAMAASGDLVAQTRTVPVGTDQTVDLRIDQRVP